MPTMTSIEQLARELMTEHGLHQQGWRFRWDNARRRAGCCRYGDLEISGSRHLLPSAPDAEVREILLHEIAHALTPGRGHDSVWRAKSIEIGGAGARCHRIKTVKGRYDVVCENCGPIGNLHRSSRNWARPGLYEHPACGGRLSLIDARPPKPRASARGLTVASEPR